LQVSGSHNREPAPLFSTDATHSMLQKSLTTLLLITLLGLFWFIGERSLSTLSEGQKEAPLQRFDEHDFYQLDKFPQQVDSPIHPIPPLKKLSPPLQARVNLGRQLFQDVRLSGNQKISCKSCHQLEQGGHDSRGGSTGTSGKLLRRNSPTVYNAAFNFRQFWDGRSANLSAQAEQPILDQNEMGGSWPVILQRLLTDPNMVSAFSVYPQGITAETIRDALSLYERTLVTPHSPFDRYLRGDESAINGAQKRGYLLFKKLGCISCHQGRNVGGNLYQKMGIYATEAQLTQLQEDDFGRYELTGMESDRMLFKVPSLRNVALTPPYFHNGSRATLEQAVADMGLFQLGRELEEHQIELLVLFLQTLTGDLSEEKK
jgi:cytochrome c peroxidase